MNSLRCVFMGTPDFAVPALEALIEAGHDIICVYTQPPRPAGRGHKERRSAVHQAADSHDIEVRHPKSLRDAEAQAAFAALEPDIAVVAAYGLILPAAILEAPRYGCLNVHASLLPRWRGAAPIQRAILAGDETTGITIMQMDKGLDTGAMLSQRAIEIGAGDNAGAVHDALAALGGALLVETIAGLVAGGVVSTPQPEDGVTYAAKIDRAETRIDWTKDSALVGRQIRAFAPFPGAWFVFEGKRVRILEAAIVADADGAPGMVIDPAPVIACGVGAVRPTRLQREGKGAMDAEAFLRGFALPVGSVLEGDPP